MGANKPDDVKEVAERMKCVTQTVLDRVDAEFRHLRRFACFDIAEVLAAFGVGGRPLAAPEHGRADASELQTFLLSSIRSFARDLKADSDIAGLEYKEVAAIILKLTAPGGSLEKASNLEVWQSMLDPKVVELSYFPQRRGLRALLLPIRYYISVEDGECGVERDLGTLAAFIKEHKIRDNRLADDLIVLKSETSVHDDAIPRYLQAIGCGADVGPQGLRWAKLWRKVNGARLGCGGGQVGKRTPTKRNVHIGKTRRSCCGGSCSPRAYCRKRRSHGPGF